MLRSVKKAKSTYLQKQIYCIIYRALQLLVYRWRGFFTVGWCKQLPPLLPLRVIFEFPFPRASSANSFPKINKRLTFNVFLCVNVMNKYESARRVRTEYILKFPGEQPPSRTDFHKFIQIDSIELNRVNHNVLSWYNACLLDGGWYFQHFLWGKIYTHINRWSLTMCNADRGMPCSSQCQHCANGRLKIERLSVTVV